MNTTMLYRLFECSSQVFSSWSESFSNFLCSFLTLVSTFSSIKLTSSPSLLSSSSWRSVEDLIWPLELKLKIFSVSCCGCSYLSRLASKQREDSCHDSFTWGQTILLHHHRHLSRATPQDLLPPRLLVLLAIKETITRSILFKLQNFQSHRIVIEGKVSFPVQAVEDNRQHGELLEAGVDHRDVPHQGPPGAMVSAVLPLLGNVILFCSRLQNESYCDSLGNCLPSGVASVIPIINYVFYCLSIIFSILDTIQPETGLEKLGTKLTSPILSHCFILTLN